MHCGQSLHRSLRREIYPCFHQSALQESLNQQRLRAVAIVDVPTIEIIDGMVSM